MIVAVAPIVPPDATYSWQFYLINDSGEAIESGVVDKMSYEWGDNVTTEPVGTSFGAIPPNSALAIHRDVDSEMRTAIVGRVMIGGVEHTFGAEFGRLYAPATKQLVPIPVLGMMGLLPLRE
ncbi:MAG TPA: hypothetical protein VGG28_03725 [Kofleriaceae bacterium]